MAAPFRTYLDLTNTIIRELNEVELTAGTFAASVGLQNILKMLLTEHTLIFVLQKISGVF